MAAAPAQPSPRLRSQALSRTAVSPDSSSDEFQRVEDRLGPEVQQVVQLRRRVAAATGVGGLDELFEGPREADLAAVEATLTAEGQRTRNDVSRRRNRQEVA